MDRRIEQATAAAPLTGAEDIPGAQLSATVTVTATDISADAAGQKFVRGSGSWIADGFTVGISVFAGGWTGGTANNAHARVPTAVTATDLTFGGADGVDIVDDAGGEAVTVTAWEPVRIPVSDILAFRGIPQNSQSAAYTCVLADAGKHILHPSSDANARTFTIPANSSVAYPVGTTLTFVNQTSQAVTIAITSDTLTLAGSTTTGSRTLAQNGVATAIKVASASWIISGTGLT